MLGTVKESCMIQLRTHIRSLEREYRDLLQTHTLGQCARFLVETDSTNVQAMSWAQEGAAEGSLIFAEHQTGGKGRHGRIWEAQPSSNLLFSLILRPRLTPASLSLITIAASVALTETIETFIEPLTPAIKWPNDILVNGQKCCGMLLESASAINQQKKELPVVLGIGLNVNQSQFPESISSRATSLLLETGRHIPRIPLLTRFLEKLETIYYSITEQNTAPLLARYKSHLAFMNTNTTLTFVGRTDQVEGIIRDVSSTGALRLETKTGIQEFHAGEVTSQAQ